MVQATRAAASDPRRSRRPPGRDRRPRPADAQQLAQDLGGCSAAALDPGATVGGEVVVFGVYYPGIKDAVRQYADQVAGKAVVDITNPVDTQTWDRLATPP